MPESTEPVKEPIKETPNEKPMQSPIAIIPKIPIVPEEQPSVVINYRRRNPKMTKVC